MAITTPDIIITTMGATKARIPKPLPDAQLPVKTQAENVTNEASSIAAKAVKNRPERGRKGTRWVRLIVLKI